MVSVAIINTSKAEATILQSTRTQRFLKNDGFQKSIRPCALDESSLSIGRVTLESSRVCAYLRTFVWLHFWTILTMVTLTERTICGPSSSSLRRSSRRIVTKLLTRSRSTSVEASFDKFGHCKSWKTNRNV